MNRKLTLHSTKACIEGHPNDIQAFIDFRKNLLNEHETWGYGGHTNIWYIIYNKSFEETWKIWENVFNT